MLEEVFTNKKNVVNFICFFLKVRNSCASRKGCQSKQIAFNMPKNARTVVHSVYTQNPLVILGERSCLINTLLFCI